MSEPLSTIHGRPPDRADALRAIVEQGLEPLYDARSGLFCRKVALTHEAGEHIGESRRYTAMCAIGCLRAQQQGARILGGLDPASMLDELVKTWSQAAGPGDLGLLLWGAALSGGALVPPVLQQLARYGVARGDGQAACQDTMELAWLLAGLSEAVRCLPKSGELGRSAEAAARQLLGRFEPRTALFRGMPRQKRRNFVAAAIDDRIASFAAQAYPIHALALFSEATGNGLGLTQAAACAGKLCSLQGPLGQWYWLYDVDHGTVAVEYPVYSVHQCGMGPMALFGLAQVGAFRGETHIKAGLDWVLGRNELGVSMLDPDRRLIWRAIQRRSWWRPERQADALYGLGVEGRAAMMASAFGARCLGCGLEGLRPLEVLHEMRSYELGWLAFCWPELERLIATAPGDARARGNEARQQPHIAPAGIQESP